MKAFFKNLFYAYLISIYCPFELLAEQSLRNKIGEMLIIGFHEDTFHQDTLIANNIQKYHVGGVILFSGVSLGVQKTSPRNIKNPKQLESLTNALQLHAKKYRLASEPELFIAIDQEGGLVNRLSQENGFVQQNISAKELGHINDAHKTYIYSKSLGQYLKTLGINLNFAPVVDLAVNHNNFIYIRERCFSENPNTVYAQSYAFIMGMHENGIITSLKHFPGHGSSFGDTHKGIVDVSHTWTKAELEPYKKFLNDGYQDMIMISHVINLKLDPNNTIKNKLGEPGFTPATFSEKIISDLLRNQLGFQGVIVTDDMCMGAIADQYSLEDALKHCINAGIDMIILANHKQDQTGEAVDIIERLVNSGKIPTQRIDEAYNRILRLKTKYLTHTLNKKPNGLG